MLSFRQFVTEDRRPRGWHSLGTVADATLSHTNDAGLTPQIVPTHAFNLLRVKNRRFLYSPDRDVLVPGSHDINDSSHAEEFADAHAPGTFDDYVRGWIGTGGRFAAGVVHFAPGLTHEQGRNYPDRADDFLKTLEFFTDHGATGKTVVRGFMLAKDTPFETTIKKSYPSFA